jgi:hypothetical protein
VEDDDHRNGDPLQDVQDLVAVRSAVNAVFVLHDGHVEVVEDGRRLGFPPGGTGDEVVDDLGPRAAPGPVDDPHHSDRGGG